MEDSDPLVASSVHIPVKLNVLYWKINIEKSVNEMLEFKDCVSFQVVILRAGCPNLGQGVRT